ncbi:MAG: tRNA uridine-5-carboxymethylaminomethyl(34) synthesis enzyme MnmG [Candidatus Lindowbacteria bacterium RIFCSPLOWO2_12_FULL_62_27]|nr:MAG: tRNA uridine-5-carboxymethylaminomethyl(34) synthesis enzyme MnmG [Candidatus Lindowbacteria bacterium RIFCSPLOWO2_12_FULL_62_27]OGH61613.1 MAG: tRNA uridine-5-carboxymethylaminomethyl(34) synthesis enzyme MnmG [Candidatus Lindowbacteria bacterium RIFCSPLOWO2_02_FULL_62_12]
MNYDVIVVGAGHAGMEAAAACARMGLNTLMVTLRKEEIGQMSCNPAIGGLAKGQLAREVDALGGLMGRLTDEAGIQFRMLNTSKGPAVRSPRAQCDRKGYKAAARRVLESIPNLTILEDEAVEIKGGKSITGLRCKGAGEIACKAVILTTGTFLQGLMHFGLETKVGGRMGSPAAYPLSDNLRALGVDLGRLKTGTPPRLDGTTVDFSAFEPQGGDDPPPRFSFWAGIEPRNRAACHLGHTNDRTHEIIRASLDRSPLYTGRIKSRGPRYCPSIEDKVVKFSHHPRHYVILEPEGLDTTELYANGIATSLPADCQLDFVRTIRGLERVEITKFGYSVEYDYVPPHEIWPTLECRKIEGLYFAGQINGTSGYEEAAALGIAAGINAGAKLKGLPPVVFSRDQAYLGVLIDDLATKDTSEPYRMFTSRAEYRLLLRQDNAHLRLWRIARQYGLLPPDVLERFEAEERKRDEILEGLRSVRLQVTAELKRLCEQRATAVPQTSVTAEELLRRPLVRYADLGEGVPLISDSVIQQVEIEVKYAGYIRRQREAVDRGRRQEEKHIPVGFEYEAVPNLTNEAREKLNKFRPATLGQAARLSGVSPADIQSLLIFLVS